MSRYINIDDISLRKTVSVGGLSAKALWRRIQQEQSIDIVRCKECKYEPICSHSVQHTTREPTSVTIGYKSVEWCSYGERREP